MTVKKKKNDGQLTSVTLLSTNFQHNLELLSKWESTPKLMIFFGLMFDEDLFEKIKEETHHYACMMFANPK